MEEKKNTVRTVDTYDDTPVTISVEEYRRLLRAWYKIDGLKSLYDLGAEPFYRLAGRIMEIVKEEWE